MLISELRIGQGVTVQDDTLQATLQGSIIGLGDVSCGQTPSKNPDFKNRVLIEFDKDMINSVLQKFTLEQRYNILSDLSKNADNLLNENICWAYNINKVSL